MPGARSESSRFMDREIEVEAAEDAPRQPVAFKVGGRRYVVADVLSTWEDEAPGAARDWRQHHHRTFYRLRTEEGDLFDVYYDWSESRRHHHDRWVLHRRLAAAPPSAPAEPVPVPPPEAEAPAAEEGGSARDAGSKKPSTG
jgi:Domain of unknown function (DUF6504)